MSSLPEPEPLNASEEDPTVTEDSEVGNAEAHGVATADEGPEPGTDRDLPQDRDGDQEAEVGLGPTD